MSDISCVLDASYSSVRKILQLILHFYPYKIKVLHLQDEESKVNRTFVLQFLVWMVVDVDRPYNILLSERARFWLNGQVNIHNVWTGENSYVILEQPLNPENSIAWCGFTAIFIIGP